MTTKYNSLEIFEDCSGWTYRFHGDIFTYTQDGFNSPELALEAVRKNNWVTRTTRPIRVIVTNEVAERLGLDMADVVRSMIPELDLVVIPIGK